MLPVELRGGVFFIRVTLGLWPFLVWLCVVAASLISSMAILKRSRAAPALTIGAGLVWAFGAAALAITLAGTVLQTPAVAGGLALIAYWTVCVLIVTNRGNRHEFCAREG